MRKKKQTQKNLGHKIRPAQRWNHDRSRFSRVEKWQLWHESIDPSRKQFH